MKIKSNDSLINRLQFFSTEAPSTSWLFVILFFVSVFMGTASVALINYSTIGPQLARIVADGALTGILVLMLPTLLTVLAIKLLKRKVKIRHILLISLIGLGVYSLFLVLASAVYIIIGSYSLANAIVLAGDASIFGWWFFISKVLFAQKKTATLFSLIQPTLNILMYVSSSKFIFTFAVPLNLLLLKLYAGIFMFLIASYIILYLLDAPLKKTLGFDTFGFFSEVVQNWLFDIDLSLYRPFVDKNVSTKANIPTHTVLFRKKDGQLKGILFAPWIHYGPLGQMGGSNFPYLLERHGENKYGVPTVIMHCAVNEDNNPISSAQYGAIRESLDSGVRAAKPAGEPGMRYYQSNSNNATIKMLSFSNMQLATVTRAPKVTEDITPEASILFNELIKTKFKHPILIDAHNSRYESAPAADLVAVEAGSRTMHDYISAIKRIDKPAHSAKQVRVGFGRVNVYERLKRPLDIAPGRLNVVVFSFNGFKYAIVQFNANNMLPTLREGLIKHIKKKYGIDSEIYTTDTHFVNSLERSASNVLGRYTKQESLIPILDEAIKAALSDTEQVSVHYKGDTINNFAIWGPNVRENAMAALNSVMGTARILVPIIVVGCFIAAAWIISSI